MARFRRSRFLAAALTAGTTTGIVLAEGPAYAQAFQRGASGPTRPAPAAPPVRSDGPLQLSVRRLPDAVELVIEGVGQNPQLQQSATPTGWQGRLQLASPSGLRSGPQRLSIPELGFQSLSLDGAGNSYLLQVDAAPGMNLGRPVVSSDGRDLILTFASPVPQARLQVNRFDMSQPGAVPLPTYAPPLQPRAVAPPLGDMAVGTMTMRAPGYLNVSGPPVTMTLRNAPAKDALMALAQLGGYGFAYIEDNDNGESQQQSPGSRPISVAFANESYTTAINTTLLSAGLQGRREGNVIFAGPRALGAEIGPQVSKVYRLNQVSPADAAQYLANLGATITRTRVDQQTTTTGLASAAVVFGATASQTTESSSRFEVEEFGARRGPLTGLRATTDLRLGTITMIGSPNIVSIGEQYLRKLDLRQRQVALRVQILDVNLDNVSEIDNSFAFRFGNNFIVNDSGQLLGAFGRNLPPQSDAFRRDVPRDIEFDDGRFTVEGGAGGLGLEADGTRLIIQSQRGRSLDSQTLRRITRETSADLIPSFDPATGRTTYTVVPQPGTSTRNVERTIGRLLGNQGSVNRIRGRDRLDVSGVARNPGQRFAEDTFYNFVRAQIVSGSTKLLASPTLILQENPSILRERGSGTASQFAASNQGLGTFDIDSPIGRSRANEAVVRVGTNVVTGYQTQSPEGGGNIVCTPELSTAGLVLGARIEKIDDNGFVTFTLSPSVSAVTGVEPAPQGCGSNLNILSVRSLDTGALRVRDGQTLIMTGVISEFDREEVRKWPILGDIPLIGQFFRASGRSREKRELVIMVTPRLVNDDEGGVFGYGYQPGTNAVRDFFGGIE